jgi:hypothetical protein
MRESRSTLDDAVHPRTRRHTDENARSHRPRLGDATTAHVAQQPAVGVAGEPAEAQLAYGRQQVWPELLLQGNGVLRRASPTMFVAITVGNHILGAEVRDSADPCYQSVIAQLAAHAFTGPLTCVNGHAVTHAAGALGQGLFLFTIVATTAILILGPTPHSPTFRGSSSSSPVTTSPHISSAASVIAWRSATASSF